MITDDAGYESTNKLVLGFQTVLAADRSEGIDRSNLLNIIMHDNTRDTYLELRSELDAYLGVGPSLATAYLSFQYDGRSVGVHNTPATVVARAIPRLQRGLYEILQASQYGQHPQRAEQQSALTLLGTSLNAVGAMLGEPFRDGGWSADERAGLDQAVTALFAGFQHFAETDAPVFATLEVVVQCAVLETILRLLPPVTGPLENFTLMLRAIQPPMHRPRSCTLGRQVRGRVRKMLKSLLAKKDA